ncbi:hypothetical protein [Streptomyces blastmyceticus]|uniref:Lipoprotein n=1 Tax=Streptomyces blastmyceticus TaxID=68180 RepID=A0ABN0WUU6_9ACTN
MKRTVTAAVMTVLLAVAGCSSEKSTHDNNARLPADESKAMMAVAVEYQQAMMDHDWTRSCQMETSQHRFGRTVQECVAAYSPHHSAAPSTGSPEPENTDTAPSDSAPSAGPVTAEPSLVDVPGNSEHQAGTGVMVMFTAVGPHTSTTYRYAVRLVKNGNSWQVDQRETVFDSDIAYGDPIRTALGKTK